MKVEINTESDKFRKMVEKSIIESDLVQDEVQKILESDEMQNVLKEKIKEILLSKELEKTINGRIVNYINDEFDIDDDSELRELISNYVKESVKSRLVIES